jgi:Rrf2 family protein
MALKHMSHKSPTSLTTAKEVSEATGCPFDPLARVMQKMVQHGVLKSEQGAHGGYVINQDLSSVSFYRLIEIILGPMGIVKCLHAGETCELIDRCKIQSTLGVLNQRLEDFYRTLFLNDLLGLDAVESEELSEIKVSPRAQGKAKHGPEEKNL